MKKTLVLTLAIAASVGILPACSSTPDVEEPPPEPIRCYYVDGIRGYIWLTPEECAARGGNVTTG